MTIFNFVRQSVKLYTSYLPIFINGNWYYIDPVNVGLTKSMLIGKYERMSTKLVREIIKPGWNVLDVGGYIGYYTIIFSKLVRQSGKVYVIEPDPVRMGILKRNLRLNKLTNVTPYQLAAGNKKGGASLYVPEINTSDARLICPKDEKRRKIRVKINTLDNLFHKNHTRIDFIKMDIQGFEGKALKGAKKLLSLNKSIYLHVEFWSKGLKESGTNPKTLLRMLERLDFKIFAIDDNNMKLLPMKNANMLIELSQNNPAEFVDILCKR